MGHTRACAPLSGWLIGRRKSTRAQEHQEQQQSNVLQSIRAQAFRGEGCVRTDWVVEDAIDAAAVGAEAARHLTKLAEHVLVPHALAEVAMSVGGRVRPCGDEGLRLPQ